MLTSITAGSRFRIHTAMDCPARLYKPAPGDQGKPLECIAIYDVFGQSAHECEELLDHYDLTESRIIQSSRKNLYLNASKLFHN